MEEMLIGVTDRTILVFIPDAAQTDGSGKTGLVAANMTCAYTRVETDNDVTVTDVTSSLNDLASLTAAHNDWGWFELSNTLMPGWYRLDLADAPFAAGAWYAGVNVMITTSAASPSPKMFRLVAVNALDGVRGGMTAMPNANADAAGGLPISDAGGLDLDARLDTSVGSRASQTSLDTLDDIVDTEIPAIKAKTDNLPPDPADASDIATAFAATPAAVVAAMLTTAITEAYRANGAAPTLAQFMSEVLAHLGEASITSTTKTINKLDHTTAAATFTLDSATDPSSITRAT